jgi:general secretion pathway protein K
MKTPLLRARPGVALMLALWIIAVVGTITSAIIVGTRSTSTIAGNYRARVVGRYAAESGVTMAMAILQDSINTLGISPARRVYLNQLERALGEREQFALGDARAAVALIDVGTRLDVNLADESALTRLFSYFTDALQAENAARAIRTYISGGASQDEPELVQLQAARPLRSIDELLRVPGVPHALAERAAEFLTVDGDGSVNRVTASDTVRAAAAGDLRDEPSRIIVVSRGWRDGHALTHEIQAVYALQGNELRLVRWRERDL